ncbi:hypothetical protein CC78DRAFT_545159 [Lojkania enalia]|uniref:Uncharacterized protein n=1 Tax=Lojkania enalia TaxID=147567 RepID=A0A9P4N287_9PLEO|nr:hypothetical protein CC78DRAFT_545159 [Didymosphaeria enalia]
MPYFIYSPNSTQYILDDEDVKFLRHFEIWGWGCERCSADDPQIRRIIERTDKGKQRSLYSAWEKEMRRRIRMEKEKRRLAEIRIIEETNMIEAERMRIQKSFGKQNKSWFSRQSSHKSISSASSEKENYLEDIQRQWAEEKI